MNFASEFDQPGYVSVTSSEFRGMRQNASFCTQFPKYISDICENVYKVTGLSKHCPQPSLDLTQTLGQVNRQLPLNLHVPQRKLSTWAFYVIHGQQLLSGMYALDYRRTFVIGRASLGSCNESKKSNSSTNHCVFSSFVISGLKYSEGSTRTVVNILDELILTHILLQLMICSS